MMRETTWFQRFMERFGFIPKIELEDEWRLYDQLAELSSRKSEEIHELDKEVRDLRAELKRVTELGSGIHAAAVQREAELEAQLSKVSAAENPDATGIEYARDLFVDCFPDMPVPDNLNGIITKIHFFMTSQADQIQAFQKDRLDISKLEDEVKEVRATLLPIVLQFAKSTLDSIRHQPKHDGTDTDQNSVQSSTSKGSQI